MEGGGRGAVGALFSAYLAFGTHLRCTRHEILTDNRHIATTLAPPLPIPPASNTPVDGLGLAHQGLLRHTCFSVGGSSTAVHQAATVPSTDVLYRTPHPPPPPPRHAPFLLPLRLPCVLYVLVAYVPRIFERQGVRGNISGGKHIRTSRLRL